MVVDLVSRCTIREDSYVGVISVCEYPAAFSLKVLWEEVCRPKHLWLVGTPGIVRMAIETVDEDDVNEWLWRREDFGKAVLIDSTR